MKKNPYLIGGILLIVTRILYVYFFKNVHWPLWCFPYTMNIRDIVWIITSLFIILNIKKVTPFLLVLTGALYFIKLNGCFADYENITNILMALSFISLGIYLLKDLIKKNKILTKLWFIPLLINLAYCFSFVYKFNNMAFESIHKIESILLFVVPILLFISILTTCLPKKKH